MHKPDLSRVRAVLFDMDGVITNTMPYHYDAWRATLQEVGIKVTCYDIYCREGQDGFTSLRGIFRQYGLAFKPQEARRLLARKEELFKRIARVRFVNGARPFLRWLHHRGMPMALVTGTSRHEMHRILPQAVRECFQVTVTGDEVTRGKPDPQPFLIALAGLRLKPAESLVIENAPFGIASAKRAGIFCVALETSLPRRFLKEADYVCDSYVSLRRLFQK